MITPEIITGRLGNKMFQLAYLVSQVRKGEIPDIFVQDPKYFEGYEDEIKKMFSEGIGMLPYTAIHLRVAGNPINPKEPKYMENPFYTPLVKTGYYIKALEHFPAGKFIVFSDDQSFARTYFEGDRFAFDESENEIEALNKLASCQNIIGANSSFSYWAAYLNPNVGAKIIFPSAKGWYSDGVERTVCPKEWIRIDP